MKCKQVVLRACNAGALYVRAKLYYLTVRSNVLFRNESDETQRLIVLRAAMSAKQCDLDLVMVGSSKLSLTS